MRLSVYLGGAAVLVGFGVLGFRIVDLEQRVALLSDGAKDSGNLAPNTTSLPSSLSTGSTTSAKEFEARLRTIEQRLASLENMKNGLAMPNGGPSDNRLAQEQAILSVVERENSRIRDVQLEWHKARWLETRKQQLAGFAFSQKLNPQQTTKLYDAIESELNGLTNIMKRPTFAEEPDQVATDWLNVLGETDKHAQELLDPAQYQTWVQGRLFERKVLWPWLPDTPPQTAQR